MVGAAERGLSAAGLRAEIGRLRELANGIEDQAYRTDAQQDIAMLEDLLMTTASLTPR